MKPLVQLQKELQQPKDANECLTFVLRFQINITDIKVREEKMMRIKNLKTRRVKFKPNMFARSFDNCVY